jgi:catechol 2,3-dioxygenase-like lactoylglutathione lyase family enzyme
VCRLKRRPKRVRPWAIGGFLVASSLKWFRNGFVSLLPVALLAACTAAIAAQAPAVAPAAAPAAAPGQATELAGIAHAAIRVADLDKSRDFYGKLGFEEAFSMSRDGKTTQSFVKVNDLQFIELYPLYPQRQPTDAAGFMHVCFESSAIDALNSAYAALGLAPIPVRKAAAGNLLFTMSGPEKQNIEYTQYMPGSRHTNDKGLHLGAKRISEQIVAMGIEMQDPAAARAYYVDKLGFTPAEAPSPSIGPGGIWLALPGHSGQRVEFVQHGPGSAFVFYFGVADLHSAAAQLKALQIEVEKHKSMLSIHDPDGNRIVFVKVKAG